MCTLSMQDSIASHYLIFCRPTASPQGGWLNKIPDSEKRYIMLTKYEPPTIQLGIELQSVLH